MLSELGRHDEACRAYERALTIFEAKYGEETHPDTAMVLHNLADALSEQGLHDEAGSLRERVSAIFEGLNDDQ